MQRRAEHAVAAWATRPGRKPLIVQGARQVGKTWLMRTFGSAAFDHVAYVNCENNATLASVFADTQTERIVRALEIEAGVPIRAGSTLLILDEIQEAPDAVTALKYFQEQLPDLHVIAAGSLLGVTLKRTGSFPVGKVEFLDLHPLDFREFLDATGNTQLGQLIDTRDWPVLGSFHDRLVDLLRTYLFVGGMPEAVATYAAGAALSDVREVHRQLLRSYELDFAKHAPGILVPRLIRVWQSIPTQLARVQRRFRWGDVRPGGRAREFEGAVDWLAQAGLVHVVRRFTKPAQPMRSYEDSSSFKLYLHDVGLLGALSDLHERTLLDGVGVFEEFKGALTEQFVLQQLVAYLDVVPMYWTPESGIAEVDFAIERAGSLVPIEVKAGENLQSKSLRSYVQRFAPEAAYRTSLAPHRVESWMTNVPLYAVQTIPVTPRTP